MRRLIYTSACSQPLGQDGLQRLLAKSQANNHRCGLTGMLCLWNGVFAQCLEGEIEDIKATFARIEADHRHTEVRVLGLFDVPRRAFGRWTMQLVDLDHDDSPHAFVRSKYPPVSPDTRTYRDPLVVFSLLLDLSRAKEA